MNKELFNQAAGIMSDINLLERQRAELINMDQTEIIVKSSWSEVRIKPSDRLAGKIRGLIHQELEVRLAELRAEFEAL